MGYSAYINIDGARYSEYKFQGDCIIGISQNFKRFVGVKLTDELIEKGLAEYKDGIALHYSTQYGKTNFAEAVRLLKNGVKVQKDERGRFIIAKENGKEYIHLSFLWEEYNRLPFSSLHIDGDAACNAPDLAELIEKAIVEMDSIDARISEHIAKFENWLNALKGQNVTLRCFCKTLIAYKNGKQVSKINVISAYCTFALFGYDWADAEFKATTPDEIAQLKKSLDFLHGSITKSYIYRSIKSAAASVIAEGGY